MPVELPVDMLNDSLKEIVFCRKNQHAFKKLAQETHFNLREIEALSLIHRKIVQQMGPMQRLLFRDVMHAGIDFTENYRHLLIDRLFSAFDKTNALRLSMELWNEGFSTILKGGTEERIHFAYTVYDAMRTNKIRKEQIFPVMRGCLIKQQSDEDPDEAVKDMIELMLKKIDVDRDGKVSEEDFHTVVKEKNSLLLECLGPVYPSRDARLSFLTTFTNRLGRY